MVYEKKGQLSLDLRVQEEEPIQYKLNLIERRRIADNRADDFMHTRYLELNLNLKLAWPSRSQSRKDLVNLEAGANYWDLADYFAKYEILQSLPIAADDVLVAEGMYPEEIAIKFSSYTVAVNYYYRNWGTVYQCVENDNIVDQFRPDDNSLWLLDLELPWRVVNIDNELRPRQWITWLYKNTTLNKLAADFTHILNK